MQQYLSPRFPNLFTSNSDIAMTFKQFTIRFVIGYGLLMIVIGIFNRVVDPAWYYREVEIKGFNAVKPEYLSFERTVKPALLKRYQPEAIILGSSYSEIGFDPTNANFTDNGKLESMSFAFARASWPEVQCAFEFALKHSQIKRAVIGIHPGNLPLSDCEKSFAPLMHFNAIDALFTYSALEYSIKTLKKQKERESTHTKEGMFFYNRARNPIPFFINGLKARASGCKKNSANKKALRPSIERKLDLSGLQRMIDSAKAHDVELVIFAYPKHAYLLELEKQCGGQEAEWQNMNQIASMIDADSEGKYRAWQFYGYNDVFAQPVRKTTGLWQDARHFNFEVGNLMLADMFDQSRPPTYARPLDMKYSDFLNERKAYLLLHPEFKAEMRKVFY
ncbi:MAG: hypothetical protein R8M11_09035 [Gallionella sp.]